MNIKKIQTGDVWGGMAATAVVLPQAMAFGVALFVTAGLDSAQGALAGLLGAAIVSTTSGISGGTKGLISAPTGPILILLTGVLATMHATGMSGQNIMINLAAIIVMTGFFQMLIGFSGGGRLIKYIPYPVISGFLTGSAILMIMSQLDPLSGKEAGESWQSWRWIPAVAAIFTFITMYYSPKLIRWLPGTIAGLIMGTVIFHIIAYFNPAVLPDAWLIGEMPGFENVGYDISVESFNFIAWTTVIPAALALSILTSLDTLLTAVIADVVTGERHRANVEMVGQGIGQVISGIMGAMAAAGTTGATLISVKTGGRRWVGLMAGLSFIIIIFIAGKAVEILPISVLAGIILYVAVHMIDTDIIAWLKERRLWQDAGIALLVTGITVFYDLMIAVGIGVIIAIILFIRSQIKAPVIHRRTTAKHIRSLHERSTRERELLKDNGDRIIIYELRGNLFFATADRLLEELESDLDHSNWIILHMRRVAQIDLTAIKYLEQIGSRLNKHNGVLIFCNVHHGIGIGFNVQDIFRIMSLDHECCQVLTFNGRDEAIEFAENALLEELGVRTTHIGDTVPLSQNQFCRGLNKDELIIVESILNITNLNKGEILFSAGDEGDELYLVINGEIDIRLPTTKHHYKRLATYGAGTYFGELSLLKPGKRVADAVATFPTKLMSLNRETFEKLRTEYPGLAQGILMNLAEIQVEHQRWSADEIQRLSEW